MKKLIILTLVFSMLIAGIGYAQEVDTDLSGANEVPPVDTDASGEATATLNGNMLTVEGSFEDLESNLHEVVGSSAHVHKAAVNQTGPAIFNLAVDPDDGNRSGEFTGTFNLTNEQRNDFLNGLYYVNVHTMNNTGGEIRGQFAATITNQTNQTSQDNNINICHRIGTGAYNQISINQNALNAHINHGDLYPVPAGGCVNQTTNNQIQGIDVDLNIHRWYPKGPDYVFLCNHGGFRPTSFTWFYGDGHKLLNIVNQNTYHVYESTGTFTVTCIASDGNRSAQDTITVTVTNLTRPTNPLFGNVVVNQSNNTVQLGRTFSCVNDANARNATCTCTNNNENAASCKCVTQSS